MYSTSYIHILTWTLTFAHLNNTDPSEFTETVLVSRAVYTDTITVLLRKAVGTSGFLSLNCSYDCHLCSVYQGVWVDSQRPATSLYLVHFVFSELHSLRQHFNTMEPVSAAVRAAASIPSFPYHFRKEKKRCPSWREIKRKTK